MKSEKAPGPPSDQAGVGGAPGKAGTTALPGLPGLAAKTRDNLKQLIQQAEQLKAESASAKAARRPALARQLAIVQSQIELAQSRLDSYDAILQFQTTAISAGNQSAGLLGQIDALERGLPQLNASAKGAAAPAAAAQGAPPVAAAVRSVPEPTTASDSGLLGTIEALFRLGREESALDGRIDDTRHLAALTNAARAPLIARLRDLNARADALAAQPGGDDVAANRARKQQFDRSDRAPQNNHRRPDTALQTRRGPAAVCRKSPAMEGARWGSVPTTNSIYSSSGSPRSAWYCWRFSLALSSGAA